MGASRCACVCGTASETSSTRDDDASFEESEGTSGDSFHTAKSAAYYNPQDARSLASADGPLDPLQSQLRATGALQRGAGNSQVSFSRGHTPRAFRQALLVERYTPNEHIASLAVFLDGQRESSVRA